MPLPLAFASNPAATGKKLYSITEDDTDYDNESSSDYSEDEDAAEDDIVSMLRSKHKIPGKTASPSHSGQGGSKLSYSSSSKARPTSNENFGGIIPNQSKMIEHTLSRSLDRSNDSPSSYRTRTQTPVTNEDTSRTLDRRNDPISNTQSRSTITENELRDLNVSITQIMETQKEQQESILDIQQKQHNVARALEETHEGMSEHMSALRHDMKDLQSSVASSESYDGKSLMELRDNAMSSQDKIEAIYNRLDVLAEELKSSNVDHRESLESLKFAANSERKSLQNQISNERMISATERAAFEKEIETLCKEKEELEVEKHDIVIEKERLARERRQLDQSEALFEQRKIAASEEIERADLVHASEARLKDEMERLGELSEFVRQKDAEAQSKLHRAEELSKRLEQMDSSMKHDFEIAERQRQEIADNRMTLARERVSFLKDRSREKALLVQNDASLIHASNYDLGLMQPSLRRALATLKDNT